MCNWMIFILYLTSTLEVVGNLVGCFHYILRVFFFGFVFYLFLAGFFLGGGNFFYHLFQIISYIFLINSILHVFI